jgi:hypothetical protein
MVRVIPAKQAVEWTPHDYQTRAVGWLASRNSAALFLDPGLGKTSSTLGAFTLLQEKKLARRMLVIAPKRVCYLVWRQEGEKWAQFRHLRFSLVHGPRKEDALAADADVYLINPEGIPWLAEQFASPQEFADKFDTVTIDELTKFKNPSAKRFIMLHGGKYRKVRYPNLLQNVTRKWGLTGTPAPNGLEDLFGQMLILDDGVSLGRYVTHFRDKYFVQGFDGYTLKPRRGADEEIQKRLKNTALRMKAEDYLTLPPLVDDIRHIQLKGKARKAYDQMKKEMVADLGAGAIKADNAAAMYSKLKQMAGGAVYRIDKDGKRVWERIHNEKLDALEELVEELNGQPVLVAYEFNHELERILERFGDIPYLGKGTTDAAAVSIEADWNAGKIPVLPVHPASTGHGLNLQQGSACHICWFNPTWDFELYDQLIRRLYRQGSKAKTIFNHILAVENSIDFMVIKAVKDKDTTQARLVQGLSEELGVRVRIDTKASDVDISVDTKEETDMVQKLAKSGWGKPKTEAADEAPAAKAAPKGWGAKKAEAPQEEAKQEAAAPKAAPKGWGKAKADPAPPADAPAEEVKEDVEVNEDEQERKLTASGDAAEVSDVEEADTGAAEKEPAPAAKAKRTTKTATRQTKATEAPEAGPLIGVQDAVEYAQYNVGMSGPGFHFNINAKSPADALDKLTKMVKILSE